MEEIDNEYMTLKMLVEGMVDEMMRSFESYFESGCNIPKLKRHMQSKKCTFYPPLWSILIIRITISFSHDEDFEDHFSFPVPQGCKKRNAF